MYALHGIAASGIVIGTNMVAPSTVINPQFFGLEEKFVDSLRAMIWGTTAAQNFVVAYGMQVYCVAFLS